MELLQRIWQENKKFLLRTGGGFAGFLVLWGWFLPLLVGSSAKLQEANRNTEKTVNRLRSDVVSRAGEEKKNLEDLAAIEEDLKGRFLTGKPADIPDPKRGDPQIQFNDRIGRLWTDVKARADQKNVRIPEKITSTDLRVGDSPADHERSSSYLEILGRALRSCVDGGMVVIERPVLAEEETSPVTGNDDLLVVYRRVGLTVTGPYEAFENVLREFQKPGSPVQVRLLSLDGKGAGGAGLRGQMDFVGVIFEKQGEPETKADSKEEKAPPRKSGRRPRK